MASRFFTSLCSISTSMRWIDTNSGTAIPALQGINLCDFQDPLTFLWSSSSLLVQCYTSKSMGSMGVHVGTAICFPQMMNPCDFWQSSDFSVVLNFFI